MKRRRKTGGERGQTKLHFGVEERRKELRTAEKTDELVPDLKRNKEGEEEEEDRKRKRKE